MGEEDEMNPEIAIHELWSIRQKIDNKRRRDLVDYARLSRIEALDFAIAKIRESQTKAVIAPEHKD